MGQEIRDHQFQTEDYQRFQKRLLDNLDGLKAMLNRPGFGDGETSIGAELEVYLVDSNARPLLLNREVIKRSGHQQLALELNRFNLEYNLSPVLAAGKPFTQLEDEMKFSISHVNQQLEAEQGVALPIGILPTLKRSDFGLKTMTDESRFYALTQALQNLRGRMFQIQIEGDPPLSLRSHDVTLEGANSSMQIHLRVAPERFANMFNALQMITPIIVALSANSPFMLGQKLWHETRIPLFRQAIDGRSHDECNRGLPSRVDFGNGWVREGAYELFAEMVHLYQSILPICGEEDIQGVIASGGVPQLEELRIHSGTVWPWNRPVYDPQAGGHLRIEMRALPAGPTPCDMAANAAFTIGLAQGLEPMMNELIPAFPFSVLARNFYEAASKGIHAQLMWPELDKPGGLSKMSVKQVATQLIGVAAGGLESLGVEQTEVKKYLGIMEQRIESGMTGAIWQIREYQRLLKKMPKAQALSRMTQRYMSYSADNTPVAEWSNRAQVGE